MKILAVESSANVASVAILEEEVLIAEYTVNHKKTHSQTLMPMLDEIVSMTELELEGIDAFAIAGGPGSFTGLRIGSATVKGLAMGCDKPVISVPTVDAMAYSMYGYTGVICPMMDARRAQVYSGLYSFDEEGDFQVLKQQSALPVEDIIEEINRLGRTVILLGDGVPVNKDKLQELIAVPYIFAPACANRQRAAAVGQLAMDYFKKGKTVSATEHVPEYLRVSQAERERAEKEGKGYQA